MKSAACPRAMRSFAIAAARCVFPLPLPPLKTSQPFGSSANVFAAL